MPECLVPESLADLELQRAKALERFLSLGDFPTRFHHRQRAPLRKT